MILLDTHVWWWCLTEPERLSENAIRVIKQSKPSQRAVASISIWEFAMMVSKRRVELGIPVCAWLSRALDGTGLKVIEISPEVAVESCRLPGNFHKDPADRIIVATARVNNFSLVTKDRKIRDYPHVKAV